MKKGALSALLFLSTSPSFAEEPKKEQPCWQLSDDADRKACEQKSKDVQKKVGDTLLSEDGKPCWQDVKGCPAKLAEVKVDPTVPCGEMHPVGCKCACCEALEVILPPKIDE